MYELEYTQEAKHTNGLARGIAIGLYVLSALLIMTSGGFQRLLGGYEWCFQFATVVSLTAAVLMTAQFLLRKLIYRVEDSDDCGSYDFVVVEIRGGVRRTVAVRLSFETQILRFVEDAAELKQLRREKGFSGENMLETLKYKTYTYSLDLKSANLCGLVAQDGADNILVLFSPDDKMRSIVRTLVERNRRGEDSSEEI